jgi:hypothetical protein
MVSSTVSQRSAACYIGVLPFYLLVQIVVEVRVKLVKCKLHIVVKVKCLQRKLIAYSANVSGEEGRT